MGRLVVVQMVSSMSVDDNLNQIALLLRGVKAGDLVLLPENCVLFSDPQATTAAAEALGTGPIQAFLAQQAKLRGCFLIAGSVAIKHKHGVTTTSLAYNPNGERLAHYDKLHLFDVDVNDGVGRYRESDTYCQGNKLTLFDTPVGRIGMAICYDLRFPELFSELRRLGAQILLLPAAFTYVTGEAHWKALLQARAIENQCYVLAANQGGVHQNGRKTWGHSMIINPWGDVLSQLDSGPGVIHAQADMPHLMRIRTEMPVVEHRRFTTQMTPQ